MLVACKTKVTLSPPATEGSKGQLKIHWNGQISSHCYHPSPQEIGYGDSFPKPASSGDWDQEHLWT